MSYGLNYMGSKQGVISSLAMFFPKSENFYDLFGGGFSVSHFMLLHRSHRHKYFHYNEIQGDLVELIQDAISGKYSYENFMPEWIDRKTFFSRKDQSAYVRYLWSFGNHGKGYLFGEDIEPYKRSMHEAVVFSRFDDLARDVFRFSKWPGTVQTISDRRLYFRQLIEHYRRKNQFPAKLVPYLPARFGNQKYEQLQRLRRLQQLEGLERLQQLEALQRLNSITLTSRSYESVQIAKNSVVYCDIPYQGTAEYGQEFSHRNFFDWARSREFPVYVSEYNAPSDFKKIYSMDHSKKLAANTNATDSTESLFWNGK